MVLQVKSKCPVSMSPYVIQKKTAVVNIFFWSPQQNPFAINPVGSNFHSTKNPTWLFTVGTMATLSSRLAYKNTTPVELYMCQKLIITG